MVPCQREGNLPSLTIAIILARCQASTLPTASNGRIGVSQVTLSATLRGERDATRQTDAASRRVNIGALGLFD